MAPRARFLLAAEAGTPATFGLRRPIVLLPPVFETMDRERQAAIALHELLHARRGDWVALVAEELLKAVLFFHPAVHWLVARVRLAREQTVDAAVVLRLGCREPYLESLVEMARHAAHPRTVPAAPFLRESHLRERVDLLLKEASMSRFRTLAHLVLSAAALVLAVSWAASAVPLQSSQAKAPEAKIAISDSVTAPSAPKLVHQVRPAYPPEAKVEKVEGLVMIDLTIGKDGAIKDARVAASARHQGAPQGAGVEAGHAGRGGGRQAAGGGRARRGQAVALRADPQGRQARRVQGHRHRQLRPRLTRAAPGPAGPILGSASRGSRPSRPSREAPSPPPPRSRRTPPRERRAAPGTSSAARSPS